MNPSDSHSSSPERVSTTESGDAGPSTAASFEQGDERQQDGVVPTLVEVDGLPDNTDVILSPTTDPAVTEFSSGDSGN